jgi:hypothetical protein
MSGCALNLQKYKQDCLGNKNSSSRSLTSLYLHELDAGIAVSPTIRTIHWTRRCSYLSMPSTAFEDEPQLTTVSQLHQCDRADRRSISSIYMETQSLGRNTGGLCSPAATRHIDRSLKIPCASPPNSILVFSSATCFPLGYLLTVLS